MTHTLRPALALALLAVAAPAISQDAELRSAGRDALERIGPAVVTVEVVAEVKMSYGGREQQQEQKTETLGVAVDPSGIVVTALSSVDPTKMWEKMSRPGTDMEFSVTVKTMKYILADNTEVPAQLVMRDSDLDLAFLRPMTPVASPMVAIDLKAETEPEILSQAFCVARMGRIARRTHVAMTGEIQGIVRKPRPYYIPSAELASGGTGVPVFAADGKLYGLIFLHSLPGGRANGDESDEMVAPVIVPAADIRLALEQIPPVGQ